MSTVVDSPVVPATANQSLPFQLSADQQRAFEQITAFLVDPGACWFVLAGYAGTGKSTLMRHLLNELDRINQVVSLIDPNRPDFSVHLTATTNKAAQTLYEATGLPTVTIHSHLGLVLTTDEKGKSRLKRRTETPRENELIVIDEASYVDWALLKEILELTRDCKILFVGDSAQLTPVGQVDAPVFAEHTTLALNPGKAELRNIVRQQAGNPIIELSHRFRETVETGEFFSFSPDGQAILHLDAAEFEEAIVAECSHPDWSSDVSTVLCWTNKRVQQYNQLLHASLTGHVHFRAGDIGVVNTYVKPGGTGPALSTDQLVHIAAVGKPETIRGVDGQWFEIHERSGWIFVPSSISAARKRLTKALAEGDYRSSSEINTWVDLRPIYARTVNKSQGSTFERVFIDLSDIGKCRSGNQIARMLYVAVSRARSQVVFTGDLI